MLGSSSGQKTYERAIDELRETISKVATARLQLAETRRETMVLRARLRALVGLAVARRAARGDIGGLCRKRTHRALYHVLSAN